MKPVDGALLIISLVVAWSLYRAHMVQDNQFNLLDLLMENGRVSKLACVFLGSFGVTSWVMVRLTLDNHMSEAYLAAYGALWIVPITAKLFAAPPQPSAP